MIHKLIIIGSGPAGLSAALYAARAEMQPLVIAGSKPGGQLMDTTEIENFPGVPSMQGPELMQVMRGQAEKFGTKFIDGDATKVDFSSRPFTVWVGDRQEQAQTVIIATGATARWLNIPSEQKLRGHGVSACATCDGFFFKGKDVAVIGGGDSAMEEATFLTKFANHVTILHRKDTFSASKIMQKRAFDNPKISVVWNTTVVEVLGEDKVTGLRLQNVQTNATEDMPMDGLFLAIGHMPATNIFSGQVETGKGGYIVVTDYTHTSVPGVFAAGDVQDPRYRQASVAAGWGVMAMLDAEKFLAASED
ncbi:MAG: thioredoxin-disulfide reductase [Patescibacteria group bacterium]